MKTFISMIAGASMLALAGQAGAQTAIQLNDAEMDGVTAGFLTLVLGNAAATSQGAGLGNILSATQSVTNAQTKTAVPLPYAQASGSNTSVGVSGVAIVGGQIIGGAAAQSATQAAASLK